MSEQRPQNKRPAQPQVPAQRWHIFPAQSKQAQQIAQVTALSPLLSQVLINRGIYTPEQAWAFLDPESQLLPLPLDEFPDLEESLNLLVGAIETKQKILICGDYDADGMTSTALLMRSLSYLGARVSYAIPSRMSEGYGINGRIVEDFHQSGGGLLLTVDNGIAAYAPIARARELGITVIITDHHELPDKIPPANAILNPKLISEASPYQGVAGVGVAYILAVCLAQRMDKAQDLTATLLGLFTLGTIADLAPLTGVNRRWVKRGLTVLSKSQIPGIQALIEVANLGNEKTLRPEAIGFRLGPRINAVGRIADPQIVIDLLTTDDIGVALQRAIQCEEANKLRQQMCQQIETQAIEWVEAQQEKGLLHLHRERVLVIVQPDWHHGVIGIVASRLVERYGVPVFIGTYEDKQKKEIRGSARSIPEFNVFEALQFCDDLLGKYGGHRAAGGFSFESSRLRQVKSRLSTFALKHLQLEHLKPLVTVDVQAQLSAVNSELYHQIDRIQPCGIENPSPVFWTPNVTVVEQKVIGKESAHLKLTVAHTAADSDETVTMKAIAWRWGTYYPLSRHLDIAYKIQLNEWKGKSTVELEIVGARPTVVSAVSAEPITTASAAKAIAHTFKQTLATSKPSVSELSTRRQPTHADKTERDSSQDMLSQTHAEFYHNKRRYKGSLERDRGTKQLSIENAAGDVLIVQLSDRTGLLYRPEQAPQPIEVSDPKYFNLVRVGLSALEMKQKNQALMSKDELIEEKNALLLEKDRQVATLKAQLALLEETITQLSDTQLSDEQQRQFAELEAIRKTQEDSIQGQEAHIETLQMQAAQRAIALPELSTADIQQQVREALGDHVWSHLQLASQKDFQAAHKRYHLINHLASANDTDAHINDYSEAGSRLSRAVEREILSPFCQALRHFLNSQQIDLSDSSMLSNSACASSQALDSHTWDSQTLSMLPPLLADQWRSFSPGQLARRSPPESNAEMKQIKASHRVSAGDRALIDQFLSQWKHPMADCFHQKGRQAASSIDQISKLSTITLHRKSFLYRWQYERLHQLIAGKAGKGGLLRQIFVS